MVISWSLFYTILHKNMFGAFWVSYSWSISGVRVFAAWGVGFMVLILGSRT